MLGVKIEKEASFAALAAFVLSLISLFGIVTGAFLGPQVKIYVRSLTLFESPAEPTLSTGFHFALHFTMINASSASATGILEDVRLVIRKEHAKDKSFIPYFYLSAVGNGDDPKSIVTLGSDSRRKLSFKRQSEFHPRAVPPFDEAAVQMEFGPDPRGLSYPRNGISYHDIQEFFEVRGSDNTFPKLGESVYMLNLRFEFVFTNVGILDRLWGNPVLECQIEIDRSTERYARVKYDRWISHRLKCDPPDRRLIVTY